MTTILKCEEFRNSRDDATITIEKYIEKWATIPLWRYYVKYDRYALTSRYSDGLWTRPNKKRLAERY